MTENYPEWNATGLKQQIGNRCSMPRGRSSSLELWLFGSNSFPIAFPLWLFYVSGRREKGKATVYAVIHHCHIITIMWKDYYDNSLHSIQQQQKKLLLVWIYLLSLPCPVCSSWKGWLLYMTEAPSLLRLWNWRIGWHFFFILSTASVICSAHFCDIVDKFVLFFHFLDVICMSLLCHFYSIDKKNPYNENNWESGSQTKIHWFISHERKTKLE